MKWPRGSHPLQNRYNVEIAKREIGRKLDKIEPIIADAAA